MYKDIPLEYVEWLFKEVVKQREEIAAKYAASPDGIKEAEELKAVKLLEAKEEAKEDLGFAINAIILVLMSICLIGCGVVIFGILVFVTTIVLYTIYPFLKEKS